MTPSRLTTWESIKEFVYGGNARFTLAACPQTVRSSSWFNNKASPCCVTGWSSTKNTRCFFGAREIRGWGFIVYGSILSAGPRPGPGVIPPAVGRSNGRSDSSEWPIAAFANGRLNIAST